MHVIRNFAARYEERRLDGSEQGREEKYSAQISRGYLERPVGYARGSVTILNGVRTKDHRTKDHQGCFSLEKS